MKFFGWGRKKGRPPIPPARHNELIKTSDGSPPSRNVRRESSAIRGSQWHSQRNDDFEALAKGMTSSGVLSWEDRLQETLRFVFSHEQEGLLAIGTFALDQLAEKCLGLDINELKHPPPTPATQATPVIGQNFVSSSISASFRSPEDETSFENCSNWKELPVFGDHDVFSDLHSRVVALPHDETSEELLPVHTLHQDRLTTRNLWRSLPYNDSSDDEELYLPGVCGLFESSWRSWRTQKLCDKGKHKKGSPAAGKRVGYGYHEEQKVCNAAVQASGSSKKIDTLKGFSSQLARRLRHPLQSETSARELVQVNGVPCIASVEPGEGPGHLPSHPTLEFSGITGTCGQKRERLHSFGAGTWERAQSGKWIRTDSESHSCTIGKAVSHTLESVILLRAFKSARRFFGPCFYNYPGTEPSEIASVELYVKETVQY